MQAAAVVNCATALVLGYGFVKYSRDVSNHKQDVKKGQEVQQEIGKFHFMFVS
jgi:hypothetical protein